MMHPGVNLGNVWIVKSLGHKLAVHEGGGIEALQDALAQSRMHLSLCTIMRVSSVVVDAPQNASTEAIEQARQSADRRVTTSCPRYNYQRGSWVYRPDRRSGRAGTRAQSQVCHVCASTLTNRSAAFRETLQPHLRWLVAEPTPTPNFSGGTRTAAPIAADTSADNTIRDVAGESANTVVAGLLDLRSVDFALTNRRRDVSALFMHVQQLSRIAGIHGLVVLRGEETLYLEWNGNLASTGPVATAYTLVENCSMGWIRHF